jgi:sulfur-oxidizing protein SoxX
MRRLATTLAIPLVLLSAAVIAPQADAAGHMKAAAEEGKKIALNRKKGNCLACHAIEDGAFPGNYGPPLINMQKRFASKDAIRAQIWDATQRNPSTTMPPFGKHGILSAGEIDKVAEYIWSL